MPIIQSSSFFLNPAPSQAMPEKWTPDKPLNEYNRITVRKKELPRVIDLLKEAARRNDTQVSIHEPTSHNLDYGDGPMASETFSFNFNPDKADGTYRPEYRDRVNKTTQLFDDWLRVEGIRNYGPES